MEGSAAPPGVRKAGRPAGLPKLALPSKPSTINVLEGASMGWQTDDDLLSEHEIDLPPTSPAVSETSPREAKAARKKKRRRRKKGKKKGKKEEVLLLSLPSIPKERRVKLEPKLRKPLTPKAPEMESGTGVSYYRPPISYMSGPVYPMHDHSSLRQAKLRASRMVVQLNNTMHTATRYLQAWYRGQRVRKRIQYVEAAAGLLQRFWRGYCIRRDIWVLHRVVVPIQALVRGVLTRKIVRYWRWCTILVQARIRGTLQRAAVRKFLASQRIQSIVRMFLARKAYNVYRYQALDAVYRLVRWWRARVLGMRAREMVAKLRAMVQAVRMMQRMARAWRWWRRDCAANTIQKNIRAFFVRRLIAEFYISILETDQMRLAEEMQRMAEAEADTKEDMKDYLITDYRGRQDVHEKALTLRKEARDRRAMFQTHSGFPAGLPLTDPAFDFIRSIFQMYDVDSSGALDEEELALMLKQLAVPATDEEFERAVEWVDKDGDGLVDPEEFIILYTFLESGAFPAGHQPPEDFWDGIATTWHDSTGGAIDDAMELAAEADDERITKAERSKAEVARRALTKATLHAQNYAKLFLSGNSTHHILSRKILEREAIMAAGEQCRIQFRFEHPPRITCPACNQTFPFYSELEDHVNWRERTCPIKEVKILSLRKRFGLAPMRRTPFVRKEVKPLVPEKYRMFAGHRVKLKRKITGRGRQIRTEAPKPLFGNPFASLMGSDEESDSNDDGADLDEDDLETDDEDEEEYDDDDGF